MRDGGVEAGELATMARALVALRQAESGASTTRSGEALRSLLTARQQHATRPGAAGKAATAGFAVHWNRRNGTPTFVDLSPRRASAKAAAPAGAAALDQAYEFIETHRNLFRLREPRAELNLRAIESGPGTRHVRMQQVYEGLPLWGHEIVLHFDAGGLYALNGRYAPTPRLDFALEPALDRDDALAAVRDHLGQAAFVTLDEGMRRLLRYDGPDTGLCLWRRDGHATSRLAWHVEIRPNMRDRWVYFVDALSGSILERYNATMTDGPTGGRGTDLFGTARDLQVYESGGSFFMLDASRSIFADFQPDLFGAPRGALITLDAGAEDFRTGTNLTYVGSATNDWTDPVSVSAHSNTARVFEYYQDVHGRDSFDDRGGTLISVVHVTDDGASMGNAFWNGTLIAYGDGNAAFNPLAGSLDIAAHEITHGVIERTVNLEYRFESGALNESIADIFGVMLDRDDWRIGEEVVKSRFFSSGALRDLEDPHNGGQPGDFFWQPAHMDEFVELDITEDNGGVHVNSGIPNRACFLIAEAIGREQTEQIYYRIMEARYLNTRANFVDMRLAAVRAAAELYGDDEVDAVRAAFDAVGILGDGTVAAPRDTLPVYGEQWIAVVNATPNDNSLYLVRPDIDSDDDIIQLTPTQVFTITGNPVSASDDGSLVVFVDSQNFVRAINSNGIDERVISRAGEWRSVALSPDGRRLATTSVFADTSIFIIDLFEPENSKSIVLYNPTTQPDVTTNIVQFADAMDWDLTGTFLVYDALNSISGEGEVPIEYWDVNVLDVDNEIIFPLFPAQPPGISIGNPSFSQTSDRYIAFDLIDFENETDAIWISDLFTGESAMVEDNGSSLFGFPRFSPDDRALVIQREEDGLKTLRQIPLDDSRIKNAAPSQPYVTEGQLPTWFAVGTRELPTNVEQTAEPDPAPAATRLDQNYPNPFNSATIIPYHLAEPASVTLKTYDLAGQLVSTHHLPELPAGPHQIQWTPHTAAGHPLASGIYIYRLTTTDGAGSSHSLSRKLTLIR